MRMGSGPAASGARTPMRNTMPRGAMVQRATQSTNWRRGGASGGRSRLALMLLRLPPGVLRVSQTTPVTSREPSGTSTKSPAATVMPRGTR